MPATDDPAQYVIPVSQLAFWFGSILFIVRSLISFYPGSEVSWFATTVTLVGLGLFVPSKKYPIASIVIVSICLFWAYFGYQRGMEYQEWLKTRRL